MCLCLYNSDVPVPRNITYLSFLKLMHRFASICVWYYGLFKAVGKILGLGGGEGKKYFAPRKFFFNHLFFKRIQFCSLVYLWFPISTELLTYFSHISIHWSICRYFYNLEIFGLAKYWGGNCPPVPTAMLFLEWTPSKFDKRPVVC